LANLVNHYQTKIMRYTQASCLLLVQKKVPMSSEYATQDERIIKLTQKANERDTYRFIVRNNVLTLFNTKSTKMFYSIDKAPPSNVSGHGR